MSLSKFGPDGHGWETRTRTARYADEHLEVVTEDVKTPSHAEAKNWTMVYRKAAVVVAPMTRGGKFLLVQQERVPIRAAIWEMPAGQIDDGKRTQTKSRSRRPPAVNCRRRLVIGWPQAAN